MDIIKPILTNITNKEYEEYVIENGFLKGRSFQIKLAEHTPKTP